MKKMIIALLFVAVLGFTQTKEQVYDMEIRLLMYCLYVPDSEMWYPREDGTKFETYEEVVKNMNGKVVRGDCTAKAIYFATQVRKAYPKADIWIVITYNRRIEGTHMAVIVNGEIYLNIEKNTVMGSKWKLEDYARIVKNGRPSMIIPAAPPTLRDWIEENAPGLILSNWGWGINDVNP